jgi:tRNA U38,U39,U40 pseudouridine synthase TruA
MTATLVAALATLATLATVFACARTDHGLPNWRL